MLAHGQTSPQSLTPLAYRIGDAARAIGISRSKLYEVIKAGELRKIRLAGRSVIRADDLQRFLDSAS